MASDLAWKINGIDLATAVGPLFATDASVWRPPTVTPVRRSFQVPGQHGTLEFGLPTFDEPKVTLVIRSRQATQAALESAVNDVTALLTQPTLTLTRVSGAVTSSAAAKLEALTHDDFLYANRARITAVLAVPGVFFRGAVTVGTDLAFNADLTNQELTHLSGSTGPIGDAIVRVTGPCTSVSILDPGTATGLSWAGSLAAGSYLYLDAGKLTARTSTSGSAWLSGGTDATSGVSYPASGPLQLWPVIGTGLTDRKILMTATGGGRTTATKIAVNAARSYL